MSGLIKKLGKLKLTALLAGSLISSCVVYVPEPIGSSRTQQRLNFAKIEDLYGLPRDLFYKTENAAEELQREGKLGIHILVIQDKDGNNKIDENEITRETSPPGKGLERKTLRISNQSYLATVSVYESNMFDRVHTEVVCPNEVLRSPERGFKTTTKSGINKYVYLFPPQPLERTGAGPYAVVFYINEKPVYTTEVNLKDTAIKELKM